jgi:hypothetical protein
MKWITANDLAGKDRNEQKSFRRALRADQDCCSWHKHNERWKVEDGSKEYKDMKRVLNSRKER